MRKLAFSIGKTLSVAAFAAALTLSGITEAAKRDNFFWLGQINKATAVINTEEKLLTPEQGHRFARGIETVLEQGDKPDGARPNVVITFEPLLIKAAGPEITKLHAGRSSQDMLTTVSLAMQREQLLELAQELNTMQRSLVALAEKNQDTVLPNYTNGVAAQPNSFFTRYGPSAGLLCQNQSFSYGCLRAEWHRLALES